jgi:hypothetical protein
MRVARESARGLAGIGPYSIVDIDENDTRIDIFFIELDLRMRSK